MDIELKAKTEDYKQSLVDILNDIQKLDTQKDQDFIDERSYEKRKLFLKRKQVEIQRELDAIEVIEL